MNTERNIIKKIENYYGPGKTRYFWSKEEWDAYQREKDALLEKAKADVAKRDNYNKNAEAAKQAGADRAVKEKESIEKANKEEQDRIKDINEQLHKTNDPEKAYNIIMETKEAKSYADYLKKAVLDAYNSGEILSGEFDDWVYDVINKAENEYKGSKPYEKFKDSLNENEFLSGIIRSDFIHDVRDYYKKILKVSESQNARYNAEQQSIKATYEQNVKNNNVEAVYETVNISADATDFTVPYDSTKTVRMIQIIPNTLQGAAYEMTYIEGKTNILTGEFNQIYSTGISYNGSTENQFQNNNAGSFTFDSTNELITIAGKGGNYIFKNGDSFTVLIIYYPTT